MRESKNLLETEICDGIPRSLCPEQKNAAITLGTDGLSAVAHASRSDSAAADAGLCRRFGDYYLQTEAAGCSAVPCSVGPGLEIQVYNGSRDLALGPPRATASFEAGQSAVLVPCLGAGYPAHKVGGNKKSKRLSVPRRQPAKHKAGTHKLLI